MVATSKSLNYQMFLWNKNLTGVNNNHKKLNTKFNEELVAILFFK